MIIQPNPNAWSCFVTAWAMIFEINVQIMIKILGHDGSEVLWPELKEPLCRRGFHVQEFMPYAWSRGLVISEIRTQPMAVPYMGATMKEYNVDHKWLRELLAKETGVIGVTNYKGNNHACTIEHGLVYDPNLEVSSLANFSMPIHSFWMISKITPR